MEIVIYAGGMPFNEKTIQAKALGGSETAAYYQAMELAKRGHRVSVFTSLPGDDGRRGDPDIGWFYHGQPSEAAPLGDAFEFYARSTPHDVLIIQRHPLALHHKFAAKVLIHQHHDIGLYRYAPAIGAGLWQCDVMTGVSDWHCEQLRGIYGTKPSCMWTVPNGVDPDLYAGELDEELRNAWIAQMYAQNDPDLLPQAPFLMLYQSRPERGLEHLLKPNGIMHKLIGTSAHLVVCGYDNTTPQMAGFYAKLRQHAADLPNVTWLGALPKPELAQLQRSCHLLCYPTEFPEVSCITAMEAMHAGLPILTSECAALPETCKGAGAILVPLKDGKADEEQFIERIKEFFTDEGVQWHEDLKETQLAAARSRTWDKAVDELEDAIYNAFYRGRDVDSVLRHCIAHSDIGFLNWLLDNTDSMSPVALATEREYHTLYAFAHSPDGIQAHYDEHQGKYYDEYGDRALGEDVTGSARFLGVAQRVEAEIKRIGGRARVMDYGCAHGHYLMPLAKAFPDSEFHGVDISARAIATAVEWASRDKVTNTLFTIATQQDISPDNALICPLVFESLPAYGGAVAHEAVQVPELYDLILAGEVLEHVWDYRDLLERLRSVLKPGGMIIITTPCGRWEWQGTEAFRHAREHLHHFERSDIYDICSGHELVDLGNARADYDHARGPLGSWVWCVRPTPGTPFGQVDYERKLKELAPRQTLSACLIVKDGERTLRKCFDSFIDWVDEVVVGIDPATKDDTWAVLRRIAKEYPYKEFRIFGLDAPVLESGFSVARNATLDRATCQWVLWLDADEEVQSPANLWKYLKNSSVDGLSLSQVHYATDPPAVIAIDHPCRVFRRDSGARFCGLVHEHPEVNNQAPPFVSMQNDVSFLHAGYVDEDTRRRRHARNLPLLERDLTENPARELNRFLWMRDITQVNLWEMERTGGRINPAQVARAEECIRLFEEMLPKGNLRMLMESVQYYSMCVQWIMPKGFRGKFALQTVNPGAPDLSCSTTIEGMFASVEHFTKLLNRIAEEATAKYENEFL